MLRRSSWLRWVPNYRHGQPPKRVVARKHNDNRPAGRRQGSVRAPPLGETVSSLALVSPLASSVHEIASRRAAAFPLCEKARELVTAWQGGNESLFSPSSPSSSVGAGDGRGREGGLRFSALRDVLSPLALLLPPPPLHMRQPKPQQAATTEGDTPSLTALKLRVVPDDEVGTIDTTKPSSTTASSRCLSVTPFSLEELVTCLTLYDLAECEDGELLLRLLGEVHRFVCGNVPKVLSGRTEFANNTSASVKLPFPQLLLVLSRLGLAEERVLQAIVSRPRAHSREGNDGGLLYPQLPQYAVSELVLLLAGFHRFALHNDYAFRETVKTLQHLHLFRPRSDASAFNKSLAKAVKEWTTRTAQGTVVDVAAASASPGHRLTHKALTQEETRRLVATRAVADENPSRDAARTVFDELPQLPASLQCPTPLLVEALTALSLSLFRRREVVCFLAHVLVVSAVAELSLIASDAELDNASKRVAVNTVSHTLLRAVRLCEEMNEPQALLADCLAFAVDVSWGGVLTDGGEDADVPSERRAYYDHVTADLVKVHRSL